MDMELLLQNQLAAYPRMGLEDCVKLLYQRAFAGGHMISNPQASLAFLEEELATLPSDSSPYFEGIGRGLCRLHLGRGEGYPTPERINGLFVHTANSHPGDEEGFQRELDQLAPLCEKGLLPYASQEVTRWIADYRAKGCPAIHHSGAYREAYHPAYRVLTQDAALYWPVLAAIDARLAQQPTLTLAIDGNSGAGKSHLSKLLATLYQSRTVPMDDFFLQEHQRTPQRLIEAGGNLDRERFQTQVVDALASPEGIRYQRYDCQLGKLTDWVQLPPKPLTILEGVYSMHPQWQNQLELRVFLRTSDEVQQERILHRSGEWMLQRFNTEWIPLENQYFAAFAIPDGCQIRLDTGAPLF